MRSGTVNDFTFGFNCYNYEQASSTCSRDECALAGMTRPTSARDFNFHCEICPDFEVNYLCPICEYKNGVTVKYTKLATIYAIFIHISLKMGVFCDRILG